MSDLNEFNNVTAEEFLRQAQGPELSARLDDTFDTIQKATECSDRELLRAFGFLLHSIGISLPYDERDGLDAARFHLPTKTVLPPFRECIGACLNLEFSKPEPPKADDDGEVPGQ